MASDEELMLQAPSLYRHRPMKASDSDSKGLWAERSPSLNPATSSGTEEYIDHKVGLVISARCIAPCWCQQLGAHVLGANGTGPKQ